MRRLLISGADSAFFGLLLDLADSIAGVGGRQLVDIGVFDFGLTEEEREILARREIRVARPENKARFLTGKVPEVATVLATIGKLSLPEHFPGYDTYLWCDADIWFQCTDGLDWFCEVAENGAMGIVPELDRSYVSNDPKGALKWRHKRTSQALGWRGARDLARFPYMNGGLFSLAGDAPHWREWQAGYARALARGKLTSGLAQAYLGKMLFMDHLPFVPLPATCNWMCHLAEPVWDRARGKFVEPFLPHNMIQAIHLTAWTKDSDKFRFPRAINVAEPV